MTSADGKAARRQEKLKRLFSARSLVFVGGRNTAGPIATAREGGFDGDIVLVNPKGVEVPGARTLTSLQALDAPPEVAFVAVPREATVAVVAELAAMDAGVAICWAAGFAELDEDGAALQRELVAAAGDLALIGPNCNGIVNNVTGGSLWPTPGAGSRRVERGPALIAQSGGLSVHFLMNRRSVDFAYAVTVGNQAILGVEDCIAVLADDPRVTAFALYLEGLRGVPAFADAALAAAANGKPVVVLKSGHSKAGSRITLSHTSSIAGTEALYDALFARVGAIAVDSATELLETVKIFTVSDPPPGRRVVFFTCSGGSSSLGADRAEALGLEMPDFDDGARQALAAQLPYFATVSNPLDYNTALWGNEEALTGIFSTAMAAGVDAGVLLIDYTPPEFGPCEAERAVTRALMRATADTGVPGYVCSILPDLLPEDARAAMAAAGVAPLQGLTDGIAAIAHAAAFAERRRAGRTSNLRLAPLAALPSTVVRTLDEAESKRLLLAAGLSTPHGEVCPADGAGDAADALGYPVVVKAVGADIAHKSELGVVRLGLADRAATIEAAAAIAKALGSQDGPATQGLLVERMIDDGVAELMVGVVRHEGFGLALAVAAGGTLVELLRDSVTLLLPTDRETVRRRLEGLKIWPRLQGYRGGPAGDVEAALDTMMSVAAFAEAHRDTLVELDVNPLIVRPAGYGAVAADALVRLADA